MRQKAFLPLAVLSMLVPSLSSCMKDTVEILADQIWEYAQKNPSGFNLDIRTMTEPSEGVAVSYEGTQKIYTRESLPAVIKHAREHDGYVCGWLDAQSGQYIFGSDKLFPEANLEEAKAFGRANRQQYIFLISTATVLDLNKKLISIHYFSGTEKEDLSTYGKQVCEYDALGQLVRYSHVSPGKTTESLASYTYGDKSIVWTLFSEEMAPENATDRCDYTLNGDGLITSWIQTNLTQDVSAKFECRYDEEKHLVGVRKEKAAEEELTLSWENGEIAAARYLDITYTYTSSDIPFQGFCPSSCIPGIIVLDEDLVNMGYFGDFGQHLPAKMVAVTPNYLTATSQFTYEIQDGLLESFVEQVNNRVTIAGHSFDTDYTYYHKLEWKDF